MNYIKEMNAFYDYMEFNPLSSSAVALWYALMHINNKTRWKEEFTVAGTVLRYKSGLKETSFKRARQELVDKGYIIYQSRERNLAPIYRMVSLTKKWEENERNMDGEDAEKLQLEQEVEASLNDETSTKTAQKSATVLFFEENLGKLSSNEENVMITWVHDVGEELVLEAMKRALERNNPNWNYVNGILLDWKKKGIKTIEQARDEQVEYQNRKGRRMAKVGHSYAAKVPVQHRKEVIPDWFKELKEKQRAKKQKQNKNVLLSPEQIEAQRKEIERLKKEMMNKISKKYKVG